MQIAYLNGEQLPLEQAKIPVLDRGLLFADAVYEVIPIYAGKPFLLDAHLQRLDGSLAGIGMTNPHTMAQWQALLLHLVQANGGGNLSLYLQVTRGAPPRRDHRIPQTVEPTVIAFCQDRAAPAPGLFTEGIAAVTQQDPRWTRCDIKSTSLLANVLASNEAQAAGAVEAILLRDGEVMEGASSNVFAVVDNLLITPALRSQILPGITRALVVQLARDNGIVCEQTALTTEALLKAQELWITSSTREIYPVTKLDGNAVGSGRPGPVFERMRKLVHAYCAQQTA